MSQTHTEFRNLLSRIVLGFAGLSILMLPVGSGVRAQTAETLSQVKKIYVESLGQTMQQPNFGKESSVTCARMKDWKL
jgi:hypothetical protein